MTLPSTDLRRRVALVTGGSRGIGRAIATALADAGADVAVNYRERGEEAATVVAAIRAAGRRGTAVAGDVSRGDAVRKMVTQVERDLGPIDILVNNAGIAPVLALDQLDEAEFDRTLAVNLKSAFLCTQAVVPGMRTRRWGRIVNISSAAARGPGIVGVHYNASKAGLEGLTRGYAAHLAKDGITVNAVGAGPDRHGNGGAPEADGCREPHPRRSVRHGGRGGARGPDGDRQPLHHRADDWAQRRHAARLSRAVRQMPRP